jgi:hypothetical protein
VTDWQSHFRIGQRVVFVGLSGRVDGPVGTVRGISAAGLRVLWRGYKRTEQVHPDDVREAGR